MPQPRIPIALALTSFDRGGTERQMTELIRRLDDRRFEVHAVCFRREGPWLARVEERAASIAEFPIGSFRSPAIVPKLTRLAAWLRSRRIEVVHACDLYANIFALPAAWLARVPARIGSRRGIVSPTSTRGLLPLQRLAYRTAQRVVANSAAAAACLADEGIDQGRITVIPNGIEMPVEGPEPFSGAGHTVMTVANLRAGKGHDVLLRALARVATTVPDVRLRLVGDGPLRRSLEMQAAELGIADRVAFLGHRDDVGELLQTTDVFAFPSLMEAFPNSVMEAMAAGRPVAATRVGGIPELIEHERNGLLVPPEDAGSMADAITRLIGDVPRARALGRAARATVQTRYSFDRMVGEFESLYFDALGRPGLAVNAAASASR